MQDMNRQVATINHNIYDMAMLFRSVNSKVGHMCHNVGHMSNIVP